MLSFTIYVYDKFISDLFYTNYDFSKIKFYLLSESSIIFFWAYSLTNSFSRDGVYFTIRFGGKSFLVESKYSASNSFIESRLLFN